METELPENWEFGYIGDEKYTKIIMGQAPPSKAYNQNGKGLPFYQGNKDFGERNPKPSVWCDEPKKIAEANDILMSVRAPVGALNIANEKCCIGRGLCAIRVKDGLLRNFLYYFLKLNENKFSKSGRGTTFNSISKNDFKKIKIPIPPLPIQKKIVAKLDAFFEKYGEMKKENEKSKSRQEKILQKAIEKLIAKNKKETEKENLSKVLEMKKGKKPNKIIETQTKNSKPYILIDSFDGNYKKFTEDPTCKLCTKDDTLIVWDGARSGLSAFGLEGYIGSTVMALKPRKEKINPKYLFYFVNSKFEDFNKNTRGTGIPHLKKEHFNELKIYLPPLHIQEKIVAKLDKIQNKQNELSCLQRIIDENLDSLPKTVLNKAFSGELVN